MPHHVAHMRVPLQSPAVDVRFAHYSIIESPMDTYVTARYSPSNRVQVHVVHTIVMGMFLVKQRLIASDQ